MDAARGGEAVGAAARQIPARVLQGHPKDGAAIRDRAYAFREAEGVYVGGVVMLSFIVFIAVIS